MRRILIPLITVIGFLFADSAVYANDNDDRNFRARLSGDNEVPPVVTETRGKVKLKFDDDLTRIRFRIKLRDGIRVTQAHLHCAPIGENGPVVAFLAGFHELGWDVNGNWIRKTTLTDENIILDVCPDDIDDIDTIADLFDSMLDGNIYVNVHTTANPGGEVRGQVEEN